MARIGEVEEIRSGPASQGTARTSIWSAIHPRLFELVQAHESTLIFVNSRRIAERLASAINEIAGAPLARAHHGSLARAQRIEIEDLLKAGRIRALVATSSLELGIDMGAIDLVIQIEAPPSVASGMQRIGRSGHRIDEPSRGIIVPKFRGDLVACAAVTRAMHEARIEASRYPRNPLDVLAQQIVAMVAMEPWGVDDLFRALRSAAPFAQLSRGMFEGVLDMLSGRYPSDDFADLRPRLTWDRLKNTVTAREGARRVAVINGGTIPDRGLYGVFLLGERGPGARVGELDEEMVFESRVGETFLLGASSWRIEEITHDRVIVSPAPGQPGKMPFWKADAAGRPLELGRHIGELVRSLRQMPPAAAIQRLTTHHDLDARAAENLVQIPRRSGCRDRRRPRRSHDRHRAMPRRDRRLAPVRAVSLWRTRPRAVGDGCGRTRTCRDRPRRRDDVDRRRVRGEVPRHRCAAGSRPARARIERGRGAGRAATRRHRNVRGEVPRGRGPGTAAPAAPAGRAHPPLAAAEACVRPARGRRALRVVSNDSRGVPRVSARRLRHAGARRHVAADRVTRHQDRHGRLHDAVALCRRPALRLRRQLHLRRRCSAGGTPGAGTLDRSGAASRAAR